MWIEKVKTGYQFRETYKDPMTGKVKKVTVTMPSKSRIAQKAAAAKLEELISQKCTANAPLRLVELIDDYIRSKAPFVKPTTAKNYEVVKRKIFTFFDIDSRIDKITPRALQSMLDEIVKECTSVYAGKCLTLIRSSFLRAYRLGIVRSMEVVNRVEVKRPPKTVKEVEAAREKYLTRAELREVIAMLREISPTVADACEVQSRTGLRFGELAALREEDFEGSEIYVSGTLQWGLGNDDAPVRGTPKNVYSVRHVALDERTIEIIREHLLKNKARRRWYPSAHNNDENQYIFTTRDGGPLDISFVNRVLRRIHYHKHLSTHIFRHTHVSLLAEEGIPLKAIMQRVSHNDPKTTLAVYSHVSKELEEKVVKTLNVIK